MDDFFIKISLIVSSAAAGQQCDQWLLLVEKSLILNLSLVLSAGVVSTLKKAECKMN